MFVCECFNVPALRFVLLPTPPLDAHGVHSSQTLCLRTVAECSFHHDFVEAPFDGWCRLAEKPLTDAILWMASDEIEQVDPPHCFLGTLTENLYCKFLQRSIKNYVLNVFWCPCVALAQQWSFILVTSSAFLKLEISYNRSHVEVWDGASDLGFSNVQVVTGVFFRSS